ncbi:hypothetical protein WBJ53_19810 [Spirosoma sp. SC4-14]|uniref:WapI family immunity protein n=1 Tax=Spirosoma sp. SC4-14 TaxID=3128900 RepID=UPI0030CBB7D3
MFHTTQATFNLEVINYESPRGGQTREDRNLLLTCLQLVDKNRRWETITPMLHTWEIQHFVSWLNNIIDGHETPHQLTFSEPCLAIQLTEANPQKDVFCLSFLLSYEATPPWWMMPLDNPYRLSIECSRHALRDAINHLTSQLNRFPIR